MKPLSEGLGAIQKAIKSIPQPEKPKEVDFSPVLEAIEKVESYSKEDKKSFENELSNLKKLIAEFTGILAKGFKIDVKMEKQEEPKEEPEKMRLNFKEYFKGRI